MSCTLYTGTDPACSPDRGCVWMAWCWWRSRWLEFRWVAAPDSHSCSPSVFDSPPLASRSPRHHLHKAMASLTPDIHVHYTVVTHTVIYNTHTCTSHTHLYLPPVHLRQWKLWQIREIQVIIKEIHTVSQYSQKIHFIWSKCIEIYAKYML